MGKAVRVYRDALKVDQVLTQRTFDCGARLSLVQDNRLIVNDPPLVQHVGIGSGRVLSQISSVDDRNRGSRTSLFRQGIELLRGAELACEQQLALPDHVH
jgi:hypothetical protein